MTIEEYLDKASGRKIWIQEMTGDNGTYYKVMHQLTEHVASLLDDRIVWSLDRARSLLREFYPNAVLTS